LQGCWSLFGIFLRHPTNDTFYLIHLLLLHWVCGRKLYMANF
jgi:hypothetical protein